VEHFPGSIFFFGRVGGLELLSWKTIARNTPPVGMVDLWAYLFSLQ